MTVPTLFDLEPTGRARRTDPETSRHAARAARPAGLRTSILAELLQGPLTDRELCVRLLPELPLRWQSLIAARSGLKKDGLVASTGEVRGGRLVWARCDVPAVVRTSVL